MFTILRINLNGFDEKTIVNTWKYCYHSKNNEQIEIKICSYYDEHEVAAWLHEYKDYLYSMNMCPNKPSYEFIFYGVDELPEFIIDAIKYAGASYSFKEPIYSQKAIVSVWASSPTIQNKHCKEIAKNIYDLCPMAKIKILENASESTFKIIIRGYNLDGFTRQAYHTYINNIVIFDVIKYFKDLKDNELFKVIALDGDSLGNGIGKLSSYADKILKKSSDNQFLHDVKTSTGHIISYGFINKNTICKIYDRDDDDDRVGKLFDQISVGDLFIYKEQMYRKIQNIWIHRTNKHKTFNCINCVDATFENIGGNEGVIHCPQAILKVS